MPADCAPGDVTYLNKFRKMQACFRHPDIQKSKTTLTRGNALIHWTSVYLNITQLQGQHSQENSGILISLLLGWDSHNDVGCKEITTPTMMHVLAHSSITKSR